MKRRSLTAHPAGASRQVLSIAVAATLTASAWLLLLAPPSAAQDWRGHATIRGRIQDENENPILGAKVSIILLGSGRGPDPVVTKKGGQFAFVRLASGNWEVKVEAEGYESDLGEVYASAGRLPPVVVELLKPDSKEATQRAQTGMSKKEKASLEASTAALGRVNEANQLLQGGKPAEARVAYLEALERLDSSAHAPLLANIARTYAEEGNATAAIETLEKALSADANHVDSLKLIAQLLASEGREAEAEAYVARLPQGEAVDPNDLLNSGIALYNENDLDGALEKFNAAVTIAPDIADVYYYRGLVLMAKESNPEALADFERLLELASDHPNAGEAKQFIEYLKSL